MDMMMKRYARVILHSAIHIQQGESLSINTNPSLLAYARELAQLASETTLQQVNIVVIDKGVPKDVLYANPVEHEQMITPPTSYALLRLDDTEDRDWEFHEDPENVLGNMALLQKAGILGAPPLTRQVAPWALMAIPGPIWASRLFGEGATEEELWRLFTYVMKLDAKDPIGAWDEQARLIHYRLQALNALPVARVHIQNATTDLTFSLVKESHWRGGRQVLADGRSFIPQLPLERVSAIPERSSVSGTISASRPIRLLGRMVENAVFTFAEGRVVDAQASVGAELLRQVLSIDQGASRLGEIALVDEDSPLRGFGDYFGYCGFDDNLSSSIAFGVVDSLHLDDNTGFEDENDLQARTGCNISDIHLVVKFGTRDTKVNVLLSDGVEINIMHDGSFKL
jgi:aminopeptidase